MGFEKGKGIIYPHGTMLELYRQGLSDPQIARKVGCTACNVYKWRKTNGLPPNVPAHGGYGRPKRKRADPYTPQPAPGPEPMPQAMRRVPKEECRQCMYLQLLSNGMAGTFCGYGLMTGRPRITLPPREDGRCPGFEEGVPDWMKSAAEDAEGAGGDGP